MHVVDGKPGTPALLLIHGTGASTAWRDPVVPRLAGATALAEQRPDAVAAQALINTGPSPDACIDQGLLGGLLLAQFPGRLLWRLRTEPAIWAIARRNLPAAEQDILRAIHRITVPMENGA